MTLAIILGVVGLLCIYFEFFLPGGILAIFGAAILLGSGVLFFHHAPSMAFFISYLLLLIVCVLFVIGLAIWRIKKSARHDSFFLKKDQEGYVASEIDQNMLGKKGETLTELKPAGHVRIEGEAFQAVSMGGYISKGEPVEVMEVRGSHLVVKIQTKRKM